MELKETESPFKLTSFETPLPSFRPRKFSSPFAHFPKLQLGTTSSRQTSSRLLADSGIGSIFSDCVVNKSKLCPKYHNEGLCELGPNCPLVHEEKTDYFTSFDPTAPEFFPRSTQKSFMTSESFDQPWKVAEGDTLARDLTNLALRHSRSGGDFMSLGEDSRSRDRNLTADSSSFENDVILCKASSESSQTLSGSNEQRRRSSGLKFKTEPCTTFHTIGSCPYGDKCNFYHSSKEKNIARTKTRLCKSWNSTGSCNFGSKCDFAHGSDELSVKFKTRLCKVFLSTGRCPYGAQCTFAHNEKEKRKDISTVYKFKTEICELWLMGNCHFGSVCHFAHGASELQSNQELPQL
ncbi:uncharacterized protein LOC143462688 isoform X1 [Clavelina lepadiformis]|uniref:uncharacterized protein LOC143462688 isoform X1 n=1 Tax=Clavelina lepadiformis TaxID=159417 RepID=UPI00404283BB